MTITKDQADGAAGAGAATKFVYLFSEIDAAQHEKCGGDWNLVRGLLGGKGANLGDMTRLGIPVPPGFSVTTEACNSYLANDEQFPEGMWEQVLNAVAEIEKVMGRNFGDPQKPLLFSCRSGAKFSKPGMMDTVLNIGLNDAVAAAWADRIGDERFVYDAYRRLVQMFGSVVLGLPDEAFELVITDYRKRAGVETDSDLSAQDWYAMTQKFKQIIKSYTGEPFPTVPRLCSQSCSPVLLS